jgi:peptide/nickel transport system substrate-binding protein
MIATLSKTQAPNDRAKLVKALNDKLVNDGVVIPLVYRGLTSAYSNQLAGVRQNAWDSELWNIADWSRAK